MGGCECVSAALGRPGWGDGSFFFALGLVRSSRSPVGGRPGLPVGGKPAGPGRLGPGWKNLPGRAGIVCLWDMGVPRGSLWSGGL